MEYTFKVTIAQLSKAVAQWKSTLGTANVNHAERIELEHQRMVVYNEQGDKLIFEVRP